MGAMITHSESPPASVGGAQLVRIQRTHTIVLRCPMAFWSRPSRGMRRRRFFPMFSLEAFADEGGAVVDA